MKKLLIFTSLLGVLSGPHAMAAVTVIPKIDSVAGNPHYEDRTGSIGLRKGSFSIEELKEKTAIEAGAYRIIGAYMHSSHQRTETCEQKYTFEEGKTYILHLIAKKGYILASCKLDIQRQ